MATNKKERGSPGALFIPAGVLIGIGAGFVYNEIPGLTLVGLGVGFLAFAVYEIIMRARK
jgi:hypothetical protein